jgi:hypothetical protein
MKRVLLAAVLVLLPRTVLAEDDAALAGGRAMIPADRRVEKTVRFDPGLPPITVITTKALVRTPKLPADEPRYRKFYEEAGVYMAYPLDVKLTAGDRDYLVVRCDSGGSNDPQCVFSASQDPEKDGVAIPGVYSAGHADTMFSVRALHCRAGGVLKTVEQPFWYAGFRSKALRTLTLRGERDGGAVVTTIAPGGFVEVVL